jgi:hypothetical protein
MMLLSDFALFVLPGLVAAGGWLYALDLRKRTRSGRASADCDELRANRGQEVFVGVVHNLVE